MNYREQKNWLDKIEKRLKERYHERALCESCSRPILPDRYEQRQEEAGISEAKANSNVLMQEVYPAKLQPNRYVIRRTPFNSVEQHKQNKRIAYKRAGISYRDSEY